MPLTEKPKHIFEPNPLACGQAVLAMLTERPVEEIIAAVGTDRETKLRDMFRILDLYGINYQKERCEVRDKKDLPEVCFLSLETPKCWHWSLYFKGKFYDPEYGVLDDFPKSHRKYYFKICSTR